MSESERTYARDSNTSDFLESYTPFVQRENRTEGVAGFLALGLVFVGMVLQGELVGVAAGLTLVVLWARLRIEFVFAAGALLFVGLGGDLITISTVFIIAGLVGLLAIDLSRSWKSIQLGIGFFGLTAPIGGNLIIAGNTIALHWIGIGSLVILATASYAFHRYHVVRFESINLASDNQTTDFDENRSSDDQTDMSGENNKNNKTVSYTESDTR